MRGIGTATPAGGLDQRELAETALRCAGASRVQERRIRRIFERSGVMRRASVLAGDPAAMAAAFPAPVGPGDAGPTVGQRMRWYRREALPLAEGAARAALDAAGMAAAEVANLVTVSCTGFAAPGLDLALIERLGLDAGVGRTAVGFMGCHGALNGLRVAGALAAAGGPGRGSNVLLCCVELCSLHFQYGGDAQQVVSNALFGDGAAAVAGSWGGGGSVRLMAQGSVLLPGSAQDMGWVIGDHGFEMSLSARVPGLIGEAVGPWLGGLLAREGLAVADVAGWALHPGGPAIIDATAEALGLDAAMTGPARQVLAEHGNMSSPSVLFVLQRLRRQGVRGPVVMLAFGPGLVAEAALLLVEDQAGPGQSMG